AAGDGRHRRRRDAARGASGAPARDLHAPGAQARLTRTGARATVTKPRTPVRAWQKGAWHRSAIASPGGPHRSRTGADLAVAARPPPAGRARTVTWVRQVGEKVPGTFLPAAGTSGRHAGGYARADGRSPRAGVE